MKYIYIYFFFCTERNKILREIAFLSNRIMLFRMELFMNAIIHSIQVKQFRSKKDILLIYRINIPYASDTFPFSVVMRTTEN